MVKSIFTRERELINFFFDTISIDDTNDVLESINNCRGTIVLTGVGKSGFIADKVSKTIASTGIRSIYLNSANALHGDIGMISREDVVIIMSKSGATFESLSLATHLKKTKIPSIAVVSKENSSLSKICDKTLVLPLKQELCQFNLIPTTSSLLQLIFGNVLVVFLMRSRDISIREYGLNHPCGEIGRLTTNVVEDVMFTGKDLPRCEKDDELMAVLVELSRKRCGCLLVMDKSDNLYGIFTDGDLRRSLEKYGEKVLYKKMLSLMTKDYLHANMGTLLIDALRIMQEGRKITALPIMENNKVVGLVHIHKVVDSS